VHNIHSTFTITEPPSSDSPTVEASISSPAFATPAGNWEKVTTAVASGLSTKRRKTLLLTPQRSSAELSDYSDDEEVEHEKEIELGRNNTRRRSSLGYASLSIVREEEEDYEKQSELDSDREKVISTPLHLRSSVQESMFIEFQTLLEDSTDISLLSASSSGEVDKSGIDSLIKASILVNMEDVTHEHETHETLDIEKAIKSTIGSQWLNDEAVQRVLQVFETDDAHVLDPLLVEDDSSRSKRIQLHGKTIILAPLAQNNHWTISHIDLSQRRIEYYDSLADSKYAADAEKRLSAFLRSVSVKDNLADGAVEPQSVSDWAFCRVVCAIQPNFNDCGIYALVNALHLLARMAPPSKIFAAMWRVLFRVIISADHYSSGVTPMASIADLPNAATAERPSPPQANEVTLKNVGLAGNLRRAQQINQQLQWELAQARVHIEHLEEARNHCQAACDLFGTLRTMTDLETKKRSAEESMEKSRAGELSLQKLEDYVRENVPEFFRGGVMREAATSREAAGRAIQTASIAEKKVRGRELAMRIAEDQAKHFLEEYTQELKTAEELYQAVGC